MLLVPDASLLWQAISASSSDVPALLEFLQRRKLDASKVESFLYSESAVCLFLHGHLGK